MISRRQFLMFAAAAVPLQPDTTDIQRTGKPRGSEFVFARLRYESGDWDYNPKVAANERVGIGKLEVGSWKLECLYEFQLPNSYFQIPRHPMRSSARTPARIENSQMPTHRPAAVVKHVAVSSVWPTVNGVPRA
jgi:hypothetical protein